MLGMFGRDRILVIEILGHHPLLALLALEMPQLLVLPLPEILSVDGITIADRARYKYQSKQQRRTTLEGEQGTQPYGHRTLVIINLSHSLVLCR
jgi:hypothetical protein